MNNISKMFDYISSIAIEKKISSEKVVEILKFALEKAYLKENPDVNLIIDIDVKNKTISIDESRVVVEKSEEEIDDDKEINLSEAIVTNPNIKLGDVFLTSVNIDKLERRIAVHTLQMFQQKLTEENNIKVNEAWKDKVNQLIRVEVGKNEKNRKIEVNLGNSTMAEVPTSEQIPGENLDNGEKHLFIIKEIKETGSKTWPIILSRTSPILVEKLLALEVPEIASGIIKIEAIARIAGQKTKVAVSSTDPNIDPIGTCLGVMSQRILSISKQLNNEIIEIFLYDKDPKQYFVNMCQNIASMSVKNPIVGVAFEDDPTESNPYGKIATIICTDEESQAQVIGKSGMNVKLISMLTKWSVEILPLNIAIEDRVEYEDLTELFSQKNRVLSKAARYSPNKKQLPNNSFGSHSTNRKTNNKKSYTQKNNYNNDGFEDSVFNYNNFVDDWNYADVTDEDLENFLNNETTKKRKRNVQDDEEIIFVSGKDYSQKQSNFSNDIEFIEKKEENNNIIEKNIEKPKSKKIEKNEINFDELSQNHTNSKKDDELLETINKNKNKPSIDEYFDAMEEENIKKKKTKKDSKSKYKKPSNKIKEEKKKINVLDEFDISEDDYDDSSNIDIDDIDYDDFE